MSVRLKLATLDGKVWRLCCKLLHHNFWVGELSEVTLYGRCSISSRDVRKFFCHNFFHPPFQLVHGDFRTQVNAPTARRLQLSPSSNSAEHRSRVNSAAAVIREGPVSNLGPETGCPDRFFLWGRGCSFSPCKQMSRHYLKLGHNLFFSYLFQVIIHDLSHHSTLFCLSYWRRRWGNHKNFIKISQCINGFRIIITVNGDYFLKQR
jgi:hypothetical protein